MNMDFTYNCNDLEVFPVSLSYLPVHLPLASLAYMASQPSSSQTVLAELSMKLHEPQLSGHATIIIEHCY